MELTLDYIAENIEDLDVQEVFFGKIDKESRTAQGEIAFGTALKHRDGGYKNFIVVFEIELYEIDENGHVQIFDEDYSATFHPSFNFENDSDLLADLFDIADVESWLDEQL